MATFRVRHLHVNLLIIVDGILQCNPSVTLHPLLALVRNECDLQSLRLRVAVAFGIVFLLWIFTGFAACTLTRSVRFLENVYTLQLLLWCLLLLVVFLFLFLLISNCKYALEFLWHRQVYLYNIQVRFLLATQASILYTLDIPLARSVLDYDVDLPHTSCASFDLLPELKIKISSCTDSAGVPHCPANYCEYEDK